jgi:hypothetical protein
MRGAQSSRGKPRKVSSDKYRADSRKLMAIGALLVVAGVVGGYVHPGLVNPVETTRGTISKSQIISGGGGRSSLAAQHLTAIVTVDYAVNGRFHRLTESVPTVAGFGEQLYSAGNPITVYIRQGKVDTYGTLTKPKPLIVVWIAVSLFGAVWVVIGWLVGRPAGSGKRREKS